MPTQVSESDKVERNLWTATDFLEWLKPGVHADLIDGEKHGIHGAFAEHPMQHARNASGPAPG